MVNTENNVECFSITMSGSSRIGVRKFQLERAVDNIFLCCIYYTLDANRHFKGYNRLAHIMSESKHSKDTFVPMNE